MSEETNKEKVRFDQRILNEAQAVAAKLVDDNPELGSVAVVLGWELPGSARNEFPTGAVVLQDGHLTPDRAMTIQRQLINIQGSVAARLLKAVQAEAQVLVQQSKELKKDE